MKNECDLVAGSMFVARGRCVWVAEAGFGVCPGHFGEGSLKNNRDLAKRAE
jgi:hypothetical protein